MSRFVILNGKLLPTAEARIGVFDGGWLHGAGLFETMRAENGRVFRFGQHLDRLCASAARVLAPLPRSALPDEAAIADLMKKNDLTDARVRLTVSAGDLTEANDSETPPLTVCVTASPLKPYPEQQMRSGVRVMISKYRQSRSDPLAGHKTTCYLPRLMALKAAGEVGCTEALWLTPENRLAEGSISNVFIVKNDVVMTPPVDTPVLPGIARGLVLEMCAARGITTEECSIDVNWLLDADEVFLTNTIMQVLPVSHVEQRAIGKGAPGPMTVELGHQFRQRVAEECASDG